jgi:tetratricopeptide (TPR) repeat protein
MASSLPEVAIVKLNAFLISSAALDDALRERAEQDLTRAMLDAGDAVGALARLEFPSNAAERFWKAEALSSLGRWDDAAPLYEEVAAEGPSNLREAAAIGEAEALHAVGRDQEALPLLARLEAHSTSTLVRLRLAELYLEAQQLDPARELLARAKPGTLLETRWRQYVEGRIYLAEDQDAPAMEDFQGLLNDPRGLTPALHAGATIGLTEARIALNGLETADNVLEDFIWHHPESPYLEEMFRRLDGLYAAEENPSDSELQHWAAPLQAQAEPRRAALALYYSARLMQHEGRQEKAIGRYTEFLQRFPGHAFAFEAWMQLGQLNLDAGRTAAAFNAFDGAMRSSGDAIERARAEIATGNADFAEGDFLHAAETFHDAATRSTDPDLRLKGTYDSALAWLHLGNYDRFLGDYTALSHSDPESDERRNLLLEEGLLQARSGDPRATATLESFVRDFPDNRRVAEAQLALAELVFAGGDMDSASHLLKAAYVSAPSDPSREQADYLAIFIADSSPNRQDAEVLRLGRQFLDAWPSSPLRPQVRMKLGELYFRAEDFANAQTQFETLAQESPSDPLADKALILAGQSAVRGMSSGGIKHALDLFDLVAKGTGPLRLYARQEQALLKARQGLDAEAVIIYDDILRSNPDTPLRLAALCGKADCLVAAAGDASPAASPAAASPAPPPAAPATSGDSFSGAVALYDQIAADPDATAPWRNQALYKKGRCLSKQGFNDQALAAFYDVLNSRSTGTREQPDFFWFEKAGYDADAMLEAKAQWAGAISILEKVAKAGGPRSAEAQKRADQLRLEHFVWD